MSISGQIVSDIVAQLCLENSIQTLLNLPRNAHFQYVGLLDIVLSEYSDKSHNFRNFIFMTSHFSTLLGCASIKSFTFSISLFVDTYIFYRAGYSVFRFKKVTFKQLQNYRGMEMQNRFFIVDLNSLMRPIEFNLSLCWSYRSRLAFQLQLLGIELQTVKWFLYISDLTFSIHFFAKRTLGTHKLLDNFAKPVHELGSV